MIRGAYHILTNPALSSGQKLDELARAARLYQWHRRDRLRLGRSRARVALNVRKGSTDQEVVWQCFVENQFEIPSVRGVPPTHRRAVDRLHASLRHAGKKPLILDCGANIGASTAWFAARYPGSTILAIEPAPDNLTLLRRNAETLPDVHVVEAGVGAVDTRSFLRDAGGGQWGYQTGGLAGAVAIDMVSVTTLLQSPACANTEPFILKIDIEGAEAALFDGPLEDINRFPVLIIEPHDFCMPRQGTSLAFFRFHVETKREFLFGHENVFSLRMDLLPG